MKITHHMPDPGQRGRRSFRVLLIGCGGNGSAVLFGLPYLHHALQAWGFEDGLQVTVMDADTVSPTNCVRQPFGSADIGQNKATILINRVNLFHGLNWRSEETFFDKDSKINTASGGYDSTIDFVISCVDTREARKEMHEAFNNKSGPWRRVGYWLDIGNNASNGQFVLGQPLNDMNRQTKERLRTVTELFPSIMDTTLGEGNLPSCSAAEALERQEPFVNNVLATSALSMITRLVRYGQLNHQGAFYNAESGRSQPISIDPELLAMQARRRRTLAKAA
jgi:PRTRC genetic system ThiF family protein